MMDKIKRLLKLKKVWFLIIVLVYVQQLFFPACFKEFCFESYSGPILPVVKMAIPDGASIWDKTSIKGKEADSVYRSYADPLKEQFPIGSSFLTLKKVLVNAGASYHHGSRKEPDVHYFFYGEGLPLILILCPCILPVAKYYISVWADDSGLISKIEMKKKIQI